MRLPIIDGDAPNVDQATLDAMVDTAIKAGVNYFDTAYPYHGGMSEIALGRSLARYPRDSYFFATKYPGHQIADTYDPAAISSKGQRGRMRYRILRLLPAPQHL